MINKLGSVAEHYHKEKERNHKLISEMERLNETLKRFEKYMNEEKAGRVRVEDENERLKDEVARLKAEMKCSRGDYKHFVRDMPKNASISQESLSEQSFNEESENKY